MKPKTPMFSDSEEQYEAESRIEIEAIKAAGTFILVALMGVLAAIMFTGCSQEPPPQPVAPLVPQCTAGNGSTLICIDGNGNVVTIYQPGAATPTPTPGTPECKKGNPLYQENVLQAWRSIVPAEPTMAGHIAAMVGAIKRAGFEATSGGTLAKDEIAIKTNGGPFSETYDVWFGEFEATYSAQVLYAATCTPARF